MKPEEKARVKIDQWLTDSGWKVINRDEFEADSSAVAVREGLLKGNREADYFLFINGKAVGILEAKREEVDANKGVVCDQVETYARFVPSYYTAYQKPILFYTPPTASNITFVITGRRILIMKRYLSCISQRNLLRCWELKILLLDCLH